MPTKFSRRAGLLSIASGVLYGCSHSSALAPEPLAEELLTAPTASLVQMANAAAPLTMDDSELVALFWGSLSEGQVTQSVPSIWITTDLLEQVSALASQYPSFFSQSSQGGTFTPLGLDRPRSHDDKHCFKSCLAPPAWTDVAETVGNILDVMGPLKDSLAPAAQFALEVSDKVETPLSLGASIADAKDLKPGLAGVLTIGNAVLAAAKILPLGSETAADITSIGAVYAAGKLYLSLRSSIADYTTCLLKCGGVEADGGPSDGSDPCGVLGAWATRCPGADTCGSCPDFVSTTIDFSISKSIAANGGSWTSADGTEYRFDVKTCALNATYSFPPNVCYPEGTYSETAQLENGKGSGFTALYACGNATDTACQCRLTDVACPSARN
jgi:hypothetical protein